MPPRAEGEARRQQLHEQALQVIREFDDSGTPFVLYLRKFDTTVLHQAALLGPALLEVGLYDQLPTSCNMLTIQNPDELVGYSGTGTAYDRTVPSLGLTDDEWQDVARHLIANAKWIVSECLMMTPGVRLELEIIDEYERHDRTVLVLPSGTMSEIDDDQLIQRFHNCVWAWEPSDVELRDIPLFAEILSTR